MTMTTTSDGLVAGVDYEIACCHICGRSDSHNDCDDMYGTWPSRSYPHHDEDD